jgi:hypothetical protein
MSKIGLTSQFYFFDMKLSYGKESELRKDSIIAITLSTNDFELVTHKAFWNKKIDSTQSNY